MGTTEADDETISTHDALSGKKQIGIFFSARWCGPCRHFTPQLVEEYKKLKSQGFEIVFASSDKERSVCKGYFDDMGDWLTLPYDNRDLKSKLSEKYKVQRIPKLVILDNKGELVTTEGRLLVGNNKPFPYHGGTYRACAKTYLRYKSIANPVSYEP